MVERNIIHGGKKLYTGGKKYYTGWKETLYATLHMKELLINSGDIYTISVNNEISRDIKEKACFYPDYDSDAEPFDYELPDGNHIILKEERIKVPQDPS
jgi:hypothetical protein